MDYDVNNQQMLAAGAYYATQAQREDDWQPMSTAPHSGEPVEIRCTYGVAPWFGLYHWIATPDTTVYPMDGRQPYMQEGRWAKIGDDRHSLDADNSVSWRPYKGDVTQYIDPTHGAQDSPAYWRGAAAAKSGLPLDVFEGDVERNIENDHPKSASWWKSLIKRLGF
jgi:hypothetical protein